MVNSVTTSQKYVGVGVGCIVTRDSEVLLLKRINVHGSGTWSTPGGHLDYGEHFEECAVREVQEETGLVIRNVKFKAITNDLFSTEGKHYVTIWTEGEYISGEPVINASYEMSEIGWFNWDALPEPLFLSFKNLINGRCYPS